MLNAETMSNAFPLPPMLRDNSGAAVKVRNVSRSFEGNCVLNNLDLDVRPGEFVSVLGKTGCGKSTLLRLIAGLDQATAGSVTIDDTPAEEAGDRLRILFPKPRLLPLVSVEENVAAGLQNGPDAGSVAETLALVQLSDEAAFRPAQLSGDQCQRVALARALVGHPQLLLLDEPLGELDAPARLALQSLIRDIHAKAGFTTILATHDVAEAVALSDRVIVLGQGGITHRVDILRVGPTSRGSAELAAIEAEIIDAIFA